MEFLSGAFLWGTLTLGIPVLLHLIFQKRYRRVPWAAMEFLLAAVKKTQNRLKVENLLLLLLRMLILLLIALAFARPFLPWGSGIFRGETESSIHLTIALDRSYSMGFIEGNLSVFDRAREEARRRIEALDPGRGDTITLVSLSDRSEVIGKVKFSSDMGAALEVLEALDRGDGRADLAGLVSVLADLAEADQTGAGGLAAHPQKRLVLVTDLQASTWNEAGGTDSSFHDDLLDLGRDFRPIEIVGVGPADVHPPNLIAAELTTSGMVIGVGLPATFVATVSNPSAREIGGIEVGFLIDGKQTYVERDLSVAKGQERSVIFRHQFTTGGPHVAEIVLGGAGVPDRLAADDRRRIVFDVQERLPLLLVDGDADATAAQDRATYFLENLFRPKVGGDEKLTITDPEVVGRVPEDLLLRDVDVVWAANVRRFQGWEAELLADYVERGGTLILSLGDLVEPDGYNESLIDDLEEPLLPARIGPVAFAGTEFDETENPPYMTPVDFSHPVLRFFEGNKELESMFHVTFTWQFHRLEMLEGVDLDTLLVFNDGQRSPALVERTYGDGRVLLFTTSIDKRWGLFPITQAFIPVVHRLVLYSAHHEVGRRNLLVGSPYLGRYPFFTRERVRVQPPVPGTAKPDDEPPPPYDVRPESEGEAEGIRVFLPVVDTAGVYGLRFSGVYLKDEELGDQVDLVGVNVDPAEGDLARTTVDAIAEKFPGVPLDRGDGDGDTTLATGSEWWRPLLFAVLALLLVESFVAQRFGRFQA